MKTKPKVDLNKKVASYFERPVWTAFPSTILLLQQSRPRNQIAKELADTHNSRSGTNATIILLSAACIEGFLVECLKSFTIGNRFASKNTFEGRMEHDFLRRISTARFRDFADLFTLTLGQPISELVSDKTLIQGVLALISFRNGIAHARSVVYESEDFDVDDYNEYTIDAQYKGIHEYLEKMKLVYQHDDFFNDAVADHFAKLVKPYLNTVVELLPVPQSDNVKSLVKFAFRY